MKKMFLGGTDSNVSNASICQLIMKTEKELLELTLWGYG